MRHFLSLIVAVCSVCPLAAHAQGEIILFGQGDMETMYQWEVPRQKFVAQPRWTPSSGAPPLAIGKAVEIAESWIKKKNPELKTFSVSTIAIAVSHTWDAQPQDRWYYKIDFQPVVSGQRLYGGQFVGVVLFDGSIVEPRAEKRSRRE